MTPARTVVFLLLASGLVASSRGQTLSLSVARDGTVAWSADEAGLFCGLEVSADPAAADWYRAPPPLDNVHAPGLTGSVTVPLEALPGPLSYLRLSASRANPLGPGHDLRALGAPRFASTGPLDLADVDRISRFRSAAGHDYSDLFESCLSMKHYFVPKDAVDWGALPIVSPVAGEIWRLEPEWLGSQIWVRSSARPAFFFVLFHVEPDPPLRVGEAVTRGQVLGRHGGAESWHDLAVAVNTPEGWRFVSWFDVMTDGLFADYQARGLMTRDEAVITEAEREADPLSCDGEAFLDSGLLSSWVVLAP